MKLISVKQHMLATSGKRFPEGETVTAEQYQAVGLPMVVACWGCDMTMVLHANTMVTDDDGKFLCAQCAADFTE